MEKIVRKLISVSQKCQKWWGLNPIKFVRRWEKGGLCPTTLRVSKGFTRHVLRHFLSRRCHRRFFIYYITSYPFIHTDIPWHKNYLYTILTLYMKWDYGERFRLFRYPYLSLCRGREGFGIDVQETSLNRLGTIFTQSTSWSTMQLILTLRLILCLSISLSLSSKLISHQSDQLSLPQHKSLLLALRIQSKIEIQRLYDSQDQSQ
jgi:hypothetical protein